MEGKIKHEIETGLNRQVYTENQNRLHDGPRLVHYDRIGSNRRSRSGLRV